MGQTGSIIAGVAAIPTGMIWTIRSFNIADGPAKPAMNDWGSCF